MKGSFLCVLASVLVATSAGAHEIVWEAVRERAVAVRVKYAGGESLAGAAYDVVSPTDGRTYQQGRTDPEGWLSFVPNGPGAWRVRVVDATGHGVEATVEVAGGELRARPTSSSSPSSPTRLLVAAAGIVALFAAAAAYYRRKGRAVAGPSRAP